MTINAKWLLTSNLDAEVTQVSNRPDLPIYVNDSFWDDLKKTNLIDWHPDGKGNWASVVGTHPVWGDPKAPDYKCVQDIVDYYWLKCVGTSGKETKIAVVDTCNCTLVGAHELWCDKWEAY